MKLKGINASSKKTTDIIKKTLLELIEEKKEFEGITVTELVKKANITRGAFYSHYNNIYDVAREFEEEIIKKVFNEQTIILQQDDVRYTLQIPLSATSANPNLKD